MEDDDYAYEEYQTTFEGPCTCEHDADEHGWGSCKDDCDCEAGWSGG